jgi:hypothetical protein
LVQKPSVDPGLPAGENYESAKDAELAADSGTAIPSGTVQAAPPKRAGRVQTEDFGVDAEAESGGLQQPAENSRPVYETIRRILLREEPRFGAASQIMLDTGARLIVLEVDGKWLKVKMDKTGTVGFVREEFVVPVQQVPGSITGLKKTSPLS